MKRSCIVATGTCLVLAMACASPSRTPPTSPSASEPSDNMASATKVATQSDEEATAGDLKISRNIREACGISETDAFFAYNSSRVDFRFDTVLSQLATCFTSGSLGKEQMLLVGHADPRGSDEYNLALGGRRASAIEGLLVAKGLMGERMSSSSRGEMDATGTDISSWAKDRRVDVRLGER